MDVNNLPKVYVNWTYCSFFLADLIDIKKYSRFKELFKDWDEIILHLNHEYERLTDLESIKIEFEFFLEGSEKFTDKQYEKIWEAFLKMLVSAIVFQRKYYRRKEQELSEIIASEINGI